MERVLIAGKVFPPVGFCDSSDSPSASGSAASHFDAQWVMDNPGIQQFRTSVSGLPPFRITGIPLVHSLSSLHCKITWSLLGDSSRTIFEHPVCSQPEPVAVKSFGTFLTCPLAGQALRLEDLNSLVNVTVIFIVASKASVIPKLCFVGCSLCGACGKPTIQL